MKKGLLSFVLLLVIVFTAACGNNNSEKLVIGTDAAFAPFEYMEKGEIVGFDVDFITAVLEEAGYEFEIKNVGWDPLFVSVNNGDVDFGLSAITITEDRKGTYDFSVPYFESTLLIMVPSDSNIKSAADLEGKLVGVQNATTGQEAVEKLLGENNEKIKKYENTAVAIMAMQNGDVEAVVTDNTVANEYVKNNPNSNFITISDSSFAAEYYGVMFKKDSALKADVDAAINTILENGKYSEIYEKWFGTQPNVDVLKNAQ